MTIGAKIILWALWGISLMLALAAQLVPSEQTEMPWWVVAVVFILFIAASWALMIGPRKLR